ncbi:hypothetical protein AX16_004535 [Volvariella volvacea WC 439]|nr:hypothetical protein AX16_004535 [Volvariella volvacea WC 439]
MGTEGLCCPIGTICYTNGVDSHVSCVDAYGTFSPAISSTDQGFLPPANAVANGDAEVEFDPPEAWIPASTQGCAISTDARSTDVVNASISFNFTGPSIRIHTIKSPQGGVFSMVVDGVPLNDTIDTFNADGELCFPIQFPPFMEPPPGYGSRNEHSITLFHHGPSTKAPNDTTSSNVVFDSFAIPQFDNSESSMTNSDDMTHSSDRRSAILAAVFILLSVLY